MVTHLSTILYRPQFSAANFAKFRGPVRKILWLTAAKLFKFRGSPQPSWFLTFSLSRNFGYWRLAFYSVMLATTIQISVWHMVCYKCRLLTYWKKIINFVFFSKMQSVKSNCVYLWLCAVLWCLLGCIHIHTSTSSALYGFPYTSSGKHEFACISVAAIHIDASTGYL